MRTDPDEFRRFHELLTKDRPEYTPFYFPLAMHGKDPIGGIKWKDEKNRITAEQAATFLEHGYNIGIAGTDQDDLVIIDIDDISITPLDMMQPTLMAYSRKRIGRHHFYFTEDNRCKANVPTDEAGEIRAVWQYVVAPGSYVPCNEMELERIPEERREFAGRYTIENATTPTNLAYDALPQVFKDQIEREENAATKSKPKTKHRVARKNGSALFSLSLDDVIGAVPKRDRFPSLFHSSETGKNTSVTGGLLHCWRHNVSHTPLSALAVMAGIATCMDAGTGHRGSGVGMSTIDYGDGKTLFKLWKFAKQEGMIPKDDPVPNKALVWYVVDQGICKSDEIIDGWKLPVETYNQGIALIEAEEKVSAGREKIKPKTTKPSKIVENAISDGFDLYTIVERMIAKYPIYYDRTKNYWAWSDETKSYRIVDKTDILIAIKNVTGEKKGVITPAKNMFLQAVEIIGRENEPKEVKKEWIQFKDRVVDIDTGEEFDATHEHFWVNPIPHDYGDSEDTPTIDALFDSWLGDRKEILYEIIAYSMYRGYPIHRVFALFGGGRNGKGQFMSILGRFLGEDSTCSTTLELIAESRFEAAKLYKKHVAFIGETNFNTLTNTAQLKRLTGEDTIPGEYKNKTPFDFVNYAKIVIATNSIPITYDKSRGFHARWIITEFMNEFDEGTPVVDTIPECEYENLCRKSIRILRDLLKRGKFTGEGTISERAQKYEEVSNPISKFIKTYCEVGDDLVMPFWEFYEKYDTWQKDNRHRKLTKKSVGMWLRDNGYEVGQRRWKDKHGEWRNWRTVYGLEYKSWNNVTDSSSYENDYKCETRRGDTNVADVTDVTYPPTQDPLEGNLSGTPVTLGTTVTSRNDIGFAQVDRMKAIDNFFRNHKEKDGGPAEIRYVKDESELMKFVPEIADQLHINQDVAFRYVMQYGKDRGWV